MRHTYVPTLYILYIQIFTKHQKFLMPALIYICIHGAMYIYIHISTNSDCPTFFFFTYIWCNSNSTYLGNKKRIPSNSQGKKTHINLFLCTVLYSTLLAQVLQLYSKVYINFLLPNSSGSSKQGSPAQPSPARLASPFVKLAISIYIYIIGNWWCCCARAGCELCTVQYIHTYCTPLHLETSAPLKTETV